MRVLLTRPAVADVLQLRDYIAADSSLRKVIDAPYRIVYRVGVDSLEILTVVHAARRFPTEALSPSP